MTEDMDENARLDAMLRDLRNRRERRVHEKLVVEKKRVNGDPVNPVRLFGGGLRENKTTGDVTFTGVGVIPKQSASVDEWMQQAAALQDYQRRLNASTITGLEPTRRNGAVVESASAMVREVDGQLVIAEPQGDMPIGEHGVYDGKLYEVFTEPLAVQIGEQPRPPRELMPEERQRPGAAGNPAVPTRKGYDAKTGARIIDLDAPGPARSTPIGGEYPTIVRKVTRGD